MAVEHPRQNASQVDIRWREESISYPRDNAIEISRLIEVGLDTRSEAVGYHGTSLLALKRTLQLGVLPAGPFDDDHAFGRLYFSAISDAINSNNQLHREIDFKKTPYDAAASYGTYNGRSVMFMEHLHIPIELCELRRAAAAILLEWEDRAAHGPPDLDFWTHDDSPIALKEFTDLGITKSAIQDAIVNARQYDGVVFVFSKSIMSDFELVVSDKHRRSNRGDPAIIVPGGLPLKYIVGIEPCGKLEWKFIEALQASLHIPASLSDTF